MRHQDNRGCGRSKPHQGLPTQTHRSGPPGAQQHEREAERAANRPKPVPQSKRDRPQKEEPNRSATEPVPQPERDRNHDNGSATATTDGRPHGTPPFIRTSASAEARQEPDKGARRRAPNRRSGRSDEGRGNQRNDRNPTPQKHYCATSQELALACAQGHPDTLKPCFNLQ